MATNKKKGSRSHNRKPRDRMTPEQSEQVIALLKDGYSTEEITAQTGISSRAIGGCITTAKNRDLLPRDFVAPQRPAGGSSAPGGARAGSGAQGSTPETSDGFSWQPMPGGRSGNAGQPSHPTYYQVERREPHSDKGILGQHDHPPTDDEVGRQYGSGTYWVSKHEPGRAAVYREIHLSSAYGTPRTPRRDQSAAPEPRSRYTPRMLERIRSMRGIEDEDDAPPVRPPMYRRPYYPERPAAPTPPIPREDDEDRSALASFARHGVQAGESIAVAAVQQLGELQKMTLKQQEEQRKAAPQGQTFLTSFMEKQQTHDREQREAERKRDEGRLAEERRRSDDQRKDEDRRWERRQQELAEQHKRDLERIAAENQNREKLEQDRQNGIMQLYEKRMELAEKEAQNREARLKADLDRTRQEAKEDRDKLMAKLTEMTQQSEARISDMQDELKDELEKERGNLRQHHDLKMKALENEHSLRSDMLKLREDMIKNQGGDGLEKMFEKLAGGVERTVKEVVDLKKIQAVSGLSPEAQAAHVDANARGEEAPAPASAPAPTPVAAQPRVAAQPEEPRSGGNGNGHGAAAPKQEVANMESEVVANMNEPFFQEVLKEWALHVESGNDATAFANMFMEWMRDDSTPEAASARKACGGFTTFISVRTWAQVLKVIEPALKTDQIKAFRTPAATEFYDQFRTMVVESVRDYWKSYLEAKRQQQQQRAAAAPAAEPEEAPAQTESPSA